jgi:hypothetical protein
MGRSPLEIGKGYYSSAELPLLYTFLLPFHPIPQRMPIDALQLSGLATLLRHAGVHSWIC